MRTLNRVHIAVALLTLAALALRLAFLPGWWDADGLYYAQTVFGPDPGGESPRRLRLIYRGLMELAAWIGGGGFGSLTALAAVLGAAAVPVTYVAARAWLSRVGAFLAAGLVATVPVLLHESVRPSADGPLALLGALLLWTAAGLREESARRRFRACLLVGLVAGIGVTFKELFALGAIPLALWMLYRAARGRLEWRAVAVAAVVSLVPLALDQLVVPQVTDVGSRLGAVSDRMAGGRSVATYEARRFLLGPLPMMFTNRFEWGGLLALTAMTLVAGWRRLSASAPASTIALGSVLTLWFLPISFKTYAVLPVSEARYLLCALPALVVTFLACIDEVAPGARRPWLHWLPALPLAYLSRSAPSLPLAILGAACVLSGLPRLTRVEARSALSALAAASLLGSEASPIAAVLMTAAAPVIAVVLVRRRPRPLVPAAVVGAAWLVYLCTTHSGTLDIVRRYHGLREHVRPEPELLAPSYLERVLRVTSGRDGPHWTELSTWEPETTPVPGAGTTVVTWQTDETTRERLSGVADEERVFERFSVYRVR